MVSEDDPYLYPGTITLRNKLGIRDSEALERAQDDLAAQRYATLRRELPRPPFTFDTLKDIHRHLFQDVYDWAGEPRTIGIRKAEWDATNSRMTTFADPTMIRGMARIVFDSIDEGRALSNLDRQTFAAQAAELLNGLNTMHPFREGNGRAQRLLLTAIGEAAGHPIAFEVATRERMVATSIAASKGDLGGFMRLIEEATDPRRVQAMDTAISFLQKNFPAWNDTYIATTTAGQAYSGTLVGQNKTDFMVRVSAKPMDWIAIGDLADLSQDALPGRAVTFTASRFNAAPDAPAAATPTLSRSSGHAPRPLSIAEMALTALEGNRETSAPSGGPVAHTPIADRTHYARPPEPIAPGSQPAAKPASEPSATPGYRRSSPDPGP